MDTLAKIATCNICLLSSAMKDCENCPFNPSNLGKLKPAEMQAVSRKELLTKESIK